DKVCEFYEDQVNSDNDEYLESTGYSLIDFTTRELYTLSDPYRGYSIRDYMIRYDYREQGDGEKYIDLLIFYAPIRGRGRLRKEETMQTRQKNKDVGFHSPMSCLFYSNSTN
ncbi:hypothetical protein WMO25_00005, partial [Coprococcus sp. CLA-AA-H190]